MERRPRREDQQASKGRNWTAPCCARRSGIGDVADPAPSDPGSGMKRENRGAGAGKREALFDLKIFRS